MLVLQASHRRNRNYTLNRSWKKPYTLTRDDCCETNLQSDSVEGALTTSKNKGIAVGACGGFRVRNSVPRPGPTFGNVSKGGGGSLRVKE